MWSVASKSKELHNPEVGGNLFLVMHVRTILNMGRKWNCINFPVLVFLYTDKYWTIDYCMRVMEIKWQQFSSENMCNYIHKQER